jgi:hypothetical protein
MPGSTHGIPEWAPTIADLLKDQGYTSGQFSQNCCPVKFFCDFCEVRKA